MLNFLFKRNRKSDHLRLVFEAQHLAASRDKRFVYEPLLGITNIQPSLCDRRYAFGDKFLSEPIWISSMTGGTKMARCLNQRLAAAAAEFGLGMGLGSCRVLLDDRSRFADFNVRHILGNSLPLFANIGIAQLEQLLAAKQTNKLDALVNDLQADGLVIHVNPLQEFFQPEGDVLCVPPIETIENFLSVTSIKQLIVKEVGQGMGPDSLKRLLNLPLTAVELAAYGGANFSKLELLRNSAKAYALGLTFVGHSLEEMVGWCNQLYQQNKHLKCQQLVVSGGIKSALDGYYYQTLSSMPAVYGMATLALQHAQLGEKVLFNFFAEHIKLLNMARTYLKVAEY